MCYFSTASFALGANPLSIFGSLIGLLSVTLSGSFSTLRPIVWSLTL